MSKYKPDLRGLSERGKKDYPKFKREDIEVNLCEICKNVNTVKHYEIIRKKGSKEKIYLCDDCAEKRVPNGVKIICLEKTIKLKKEKEEPLEFKKENEEIGDSLLV